MRGLMRWLGWGVLGVLLLAACQRGGLGVASTGPVVRIDAPASGTRIPTGREVEIQSTATDPALVQRVELYVNGDLIREDSPPAPEGQESFTVLQRWVPVAPGPVQVEVYAWNAQGTRSRAAAVTLEAVGEPLASPALTATVPLSPTAAATFPAVSTPTIVAIGGIEGRVEAEVGLNVRAGPATTFERIGGVNQNETVTGVARNAAGDWVKIRFGAEQQEGWVAAEYVTWQGELATLPVEG